MLSQQILNMEAALVEPFASDHRKNKDVAHDKMMHDKNKETAKHNDELTKLESEYAEEVGTSVVDQMQLQCDAVP